MTIDNTTTSLLQLSPFGTPPYSIRGASQTLTPLSESKSFKRTVNGGLLSLAAPQFRKYGSVITVSSEADVPSWDGIFPGATVTVSCIAELSQLCPDPAHYTLSRSAVSGSIRFANGFVFYRPVLSMLVTDLSQTSDEYGAAKDWTLTSEEV